MSAAGTVRDRILPGRWAPLLLFAAACGGEASEGAGEGATVEAATDTDPMPMHVRIVEPAEGAEVESPIQVRFEVEGLDIVPAGTDQPRSGHHHLLVDHDLPPEGQPVPSTEGYVHLGQAQTVTDLELPPGEHRLIALVADFAHVPLQPWVVDTVHVVVR